MSTNDLTATVLELKELKTMHEELAAEIILLEDRIKQHMAENDLDTVCAADCKVTWKEVISVRVDTTAIKRDLPEIAEQYSRTVATHRFMFQY